MELCGNNLRHWLRNHQNVDKDISIKILMQIAEGLEHIHKHGVIHRDLKPENILFSLENPLKGKIGDFGIATHYIRLARELLYTWHRNNLVQDMVNLLIYTPWV